MTNNGNGNVVNGICVKLTSLWFGVAVVLAGCANQATSGDDVQLKQGALGNARGAQACVVGTTSLRLASRVTVAGGVAANSFTVEGGSVVNGGANINNVGGATVRIS